MLTEKLPSTQLNAIRRITSGCPISGPYPASRSPGDRAVVAVCAAVVILNILGVFGCATGQEPPCVWAPTSAPSCIVRTP